ncbi:MAG: D-alanyl-D-alanine carboxypeptidase [Thermodesulfobacteriota bacterium]|nr:D-alanyl-D-alanine carboxypeptidase [Thermodesulfobacteriota bacterium]
MKEPRTPSRKTYLLRRSSLAGIIRIGLIAGFYIILNSVSLPRPVFSHSLQDVSCLNSISSKDAILVADPDGQILYRKNETIKCIPASTLKLLTALAAIHHLGNSFRFRTEFYMDTDQNLVVKSYGDPLLISEVWQEIADALAKEIRNFKALILDDTYFSRNIRIPGRGNSTNPYDAPAGALCANFNTIFFDRDKQGQIISAESHTPMIPYVSQKIRVLGLRQGRYTFSHDHEETARYAGKLLLHFLKERDVVSQGTIHLRTVKPGDRLIHTYLSRFTLEQAIEKMMGFSNNFMANQILIALGAYVYGPPGTLAKGVKVVSAYASEELGLKDIEFVEGSGISRKNRVSALDMLVILRAFRPYRHLLKSSGEVLYKTGTLRGVRTRVGYIETARKEPFCFVIFLNRANSADILSLMECIKGFILDCPGNRR